MKPNQILLVVLLTVILLLVMTAHGHAQPPPLPFMPNQAPIDGGLGLLAAAGGAYAYKKLRARRRE